MCNFFSFYTLSKPDRKTEERGAGLPGCQSISESSEHPCNCQSFQNRTEIGGGGLGGWGGGGVV